MSLRPAPSFLALALTCAALAATPANAVIYMGTSAGGACHAASNGPSSFRFTNLLAENVGTTDQYLVCGFADFTVNGTSQAALPPDTLKIYFGAGATGGTLTCTAQMGYWLGGAAHIASSNVQSRVLVAGESSAMAWTSDVLARTKEYESLLLNCKVPPGFKLGLIQRVEQEPTSGNGWTP